jgi:hypothetical protein
VTFFTGDATQIPAFTPFNGVALLSAALPSAHPGIVTGQPAGLNQAAPASATPTLPFGQPAMLSQPTPEDMRQHAAATIQRLYRWLEAVVPTLPQVGVLVPALVTAVQQYEAQQYGPCLQQALMVAQTAQQVQLSVPGLPPL